MDELKNEILRVRGLRDEKKEELKEIEEYLDELESEMLQYFKDHNITSFKDDAGNSFIQVLTHSARVADFGLLTEYIMSKGRVDLLQKRLNQSAVDELWEGGEFIPGIEDVSKINLRIRKG